MSRVVCIIQARMGSTRLPGKVLMPLLDKPLLWWDVYRARQSRMLDEVVIATTTQPQDNAIVALCKQEGYAHFRGSEDDVLDRYYKAARQYDADVVVRITSDCPVIDPHVIDYTLSAHLSAAPMPDYTSNSTVRTFPRGLDTEVISFAALERCWQVATMPQEREHVTYHIYQHPDQFRLHRATNPVDYSDFRWTVDTPEDFDLVRRVYEHFGHGDFRWQDMLALMQVRPDLAVINAHIEQKKV